MSEGVGRGEGRFSPRAFRREPGPGDNWRLDFQTPKRDVALGYVHEPTRFRDSKFPYANGSKLRATGGGPGVEREKRTQPRRMSTGRRKEFDCQEGQENRGK